MFQYNFRNTIAKPTPFSFVNKARESFKPEWFSCSCPHLSATLLKLKLLTVR